MEPSELAALPEAIARVQRSSLASGYMTPLETRTVELPFPSDAAPDASIPPWVIRVRCTRPPVASPALHALPVLASPALSPALHSLLPSPAPPSSPVVHVTHATHAIARPMPTLSPAIPGRRNSIPSRTPSPFCPPEPQAVVTPLPSGYSLLLNRYPAVPGSLLLCTTEPVPQDTPLAPGDLAVLEPCVRAAFPAGFLCFYNCGTQSGSSQPTRHMQVVPLDRPYALDAVFARHVRDAPYNEPSAVPGLPFVHAVCRPRPGAWHEAYETLLDAVQRPDIPSHNWLCTGEWAVVVPRMSDVPEGIQGVSLNSLAFVGAALARNEEALETIRRVGFMNILAKVAIPL